MSLDYCTTTPILLEVFAQHYTTALGYSPNISRVSIQVFLVRFHSSLLEGEIWSSWPPGCTLQNNIVVKSWKPGNQQIVSQALTSSMSVTTAQFADKNSSPNAIKICKKRRKQWLSTWQCYSLVWRWRQAYQLCLSLWVVIHTHLFIN